MKKSYKITIEDTDTGVDLTRYYAKEVKDDPEQLQEHVRDMVESLDEVVLEAKRLTVNNN